jgi:hypothetical protein
VRLSAPSRISLIYLAFGFAWIILSDSFVLSLGVSEAQVARLLMTPAAGERRGVCLRITPTSCESWWELQLYLTDESGSPVERTGENPSETTTAFCEALAGQMGGTVTISPREITIQVPGKTPGSTHTSRESHQTQRGDARQRGDAERRRHVTNGFHVATSLKKKGDHRDGDRLNPSYKSTYR